MVSALVLFLIGCEARDWEPTGWNREKLNELEVGMTKAKVLEIMGEPYRREAQNENEWLLYAVENKMGFNDLGHYVRKPDRQWLTPLLFQNGKLMGWGQNYWTTEEQKLDLKIDQTIKQDNN